LAAQKGYTVCLTYRSQKESALSLKNKIEGPAAKVFTFQADVRDEESVKNLFTKIDNEAGSLDVLVNNAGVAEETTTINNYTAQRLQNVFSTNVFEVFYCCKEAITRMSTAKGGHGGSIVNISSVSARTGAPHEYIDYAASKAAVDTITFGVGSGHAGNPGKWPASRINLYGFSWHDR